MLFIPFITACASLGGTIGGAVATVSGTSVVTGTAVGTITGAGVGTAICIAESDSLCGDYY